MQNEIRSAADWLGPGHIVCRKFRDLVMIAVLLLLPCMQRV